MTTLDIRKLNRWLKANVPFHAKAERRPHREVVIGAETGRDLTPFADAIRAEFGAGIFRLHIYGQTNWITIITL